MKRCIFFACLSILLISSVGKADTASTTKATYIEVYYDVFTMNVWQYDQNSGLQRVGTFPVTLTRKKYRLPKKAYITDVTFGPTWKPTLGIKKRYFNKHGVHLKDTYGPGEPGNAMGAFKWKLRFLQEPGFYAGDDVTRVHEEKKPERIQTRDSSGCVRLLREDGLRLTKLLWGQKVRIMIYTTSDNELKYFDEKEMLATST